MDVPAWIQSISLNQKVLPLFLQGIYHVANEGSCSWHEFAAEIFRLSGVEVELAGVSGSEYPLPADRPANGAIYDPAGPKLRH